MSIVLHVDVDCFFVQVEQLRHPELQGKAVAIQQHQDIIAVNYEAKRCGVTKHMAPAEARKLLQPQGGVVWHVHCESGGRVSYAPYREASAALLALLREQPCSAVVEKASIDEAYVLHSQPVPHEHLDMAVGVRSAQIIRAAALARLGLRVSVGVARNKLLAKMASQAAKPDGIKEVEAAGDVVALLACTCVTRLPGCGGKMADQLRAAGVHVVADLQAWSAGRLQGVLGMRPQLAASLCEWAHGRCSALVCDRGPPASLSVRMSLTAQPLAAHARHAGKLDPLRVGAPDYLPRMRQLVTVMGRDLLARVAADRGQHDRWPRMQGFMVMLTHADGQHKSGSKSCAFPSQALSADELESAYVRNAVQLAGALVAGQVGGYVVTQVQLSAGSFHACAAAAPAITRFFKPRAAAGAPQLRGGGGEAALPDARACSTHAGAAQAVRADQGCVAPAGHGAAHGATQPPADAQRGAQRRADAHGGVQAPADAHSSVQASADAHGGAQPWGDVRPACLPWPRNEDSSGDGSGDSDSGDGFMRDLADADSSATALSTDAVQPPAARSWDAAAAEASTADAARRSGQGVMALGAPDKTGAGVADGEEVALAGVDVAEQRRILAQLQREHALRATTAVGKRHASGAASAGIAHKRGKQEAQRGGRQLSIAQMFRRAL